MFFFFFFWDFPNIISERLTYAMERMNMDVNTLALLADVSPTTVQRWLNGEYEPRNKNLREIAHVLNTSSSYLNGEVD
ncbi:MAG: helix-turn-helix transcriptional regulator [Anaerotignum sp.]|nr:helix-turn-helix transcriptional regulator [Anaerotignum sp.]MDY3927350.1 helix-turn-helix transcriptional regulator [Anaerotignum sp.]